MGKKLPEGMTDSMFRAIHWLDKNGDEGSGAWVWHKRDKDYRVMCRGEISPFMGSTWRHLITQGYLQLRDSRIETTMAGTLFLDMYPEAQPTYVERYKAGKVQPHPHAE